MHLLGSVRTSQHSLLSIMQWFDGYYGYLRSAMIKRRRTRRRLDEAEKFLISSSSGNPVNNPSEDLRSCMMSECTENKLIFSSLYSFVKPSFILVCRYGLPSITSNMARSFVHTAMQNYDLIDEETLLRYFTYLTGTEEKPQSSPAAALLHAIHPVLNHPSILTEMCTFVSLVQMKSLSPYG